MDEAQVAELYRSHGPSVLRRARQILGREDASHDVLQEIFVSLLTEPQQFAGQSSVLTWLYSVTTHKCLNRMRNERTRERILDQRGKSLDEAHDPDTDNTLVVREFLAQLPDELGKAAVYSYVDGMPLEDIARAMECSSRKVAYLLEKVRERADKRGLAQW